jgi:hypothetical protein
MAMKQVGHEFVGGTLTAHRALHHRKIEARKLQQIELRGAILLPARRRTEIPPPWCMMLWLADTASAVVNKGVHALFLGACVVDSPGCLSTACINISVNAYRSSPFRLTDDRSFVTGLEHNLGKPIIVECKTTNIGGGGK